MISIYKNNAVLIYFIFMSLVVGAVFGSFLNCMAWRICNKKSIISERSFCPICKHKLGVLDLVPIFSWIFLRGKCRYCKSKISVRYLLSEILLSVITLITVLHFDLTTECLRDLIFIFCLFCLSLTDIETMIIPNRFIIISILTWIAFLPFMGYSNKKIIFSVVSGLSLFIFLLLFSLLMKMILKKNALGEGDIKLFAVGGLYIGIKQSLFAIALACVFGTIYLILKKKKNKSDIKIIPFASAISLAIWIFLLKGDVIVNYFF